MNQIDEILSDDEEMTEEARESIQTYYAKAWAAAAAHTQSEKNVPDPKSYTEALGGSDKESWRKAMDDEWKSLVENGTWKLVKLPKGRKAIGVKWVYKTKYDVNGKLSRYKARLVVKGYNQKHGYDYDETFAPVANYSSVRLLLAIAASKDLDKKCWTKMTASTLQFAVLLNRNWGCCDL